MHAQLVYFLEQFHRLTFKEKKEKKNDKNVSSSTWKNSYAQYIFFFFFILSIEVLNLFINRTLRFTLTNNYILFDVSFTKILEADSNFDLTNKQY